MTEQEPDEGVRVTDKRRIDPQTGQVREGAAAEQAAPSPPAAGTEEDSKVAELTADLQRVSAEYANYRKRVDRDREAMNDLAAGSVVSALLPILDDLGRAKEHDQYEGALKSIGDQVEGTMAKLGLEAFGAEGDVFDPTIHEAMTHTSGNDHDQPVVATVFQVGYTFRGRVLRPARVGVEE